MLTAAGQAPLGHIPFTPEAKRTLELALREALQLGHDYIGTGHILLGLTTDPGCKGAEVLMELGAGLDARPGAGYRAAARRRSPASRRRDASGGWYREREQVRRPDSPARGRRAAGRDGPQPGRSR